MTKRLAGLTIAILLTLTIASIPSSRVSSDQGKSTLTADAVMSHIVPSAKCQETFWGTYSDPCEGARSFCRGQQLMLMDLCVATGRSKILCMTDYNDWYRDCLMRSNCL